jgi:hypothetical protein
MEAARTSETSVDNYFIRQYIPEDNSEPLNSACPLKHAKHFCSLPSCLPSTRHQYNTNTLCVQEERERPVGAPLTVLAFTS